MSRVKANAIRELSIAEMDTKQSSLQKELFDLRQKKVTGQLEKPHQFKAIRRQIAQLNTIKREKQNDQPKSKR